MPTGYTAGVADGTITDLKPFVLQAARGMGALVSMRDMPSNAEIPDKFEPTGYHSDQLFKARVQLNLLSEMSTFECDAKAAQEVAEYDKDRRESHDKHNETLDRYNRMLDKVTAWKGAPEGIKEFALSQLKSGRDFDCRTPWKFYRDRPSEDGETWRATAIAATVKDIEYHSVEDAKERARVDSRNAWVAQLRRSLDNE